MKPSPRSSRSTKKTCSCCEEKTNNNNNSAEPMDCEYYGNPQSTKSQIDDTEKLLITKKQESEVKNNDTNNSTICDNSANNFVESEDYENHNGKLLNESLIDYVRNVGLGPVQLKRNQRTKWQRVPHDHDQVVDQSSGGGEDQLTEKDLPDEFRERVRISEPSSATNPKKLLKDQRAKASTSNTTLSSSAKEASRSKNKINPKTPPNPDHTRTHHITWDFSVEILSESNDDHQTCILCERDLTSSVLELKDDYEDIYIEQIKLPNVAVLSCGHTFHCECLENITPPDQCTDPPCLFCLSCES